MESDVDHVVGVVLGPGGTPAEGASVFCDEYFHPIGDHKISLLLWRYPEQGDDGAWRWPNEHEAPTAVPNHGTTDAQGRYQVALPTREGRAAGRLKVWATFEGLVAEKVEFSNAGGAVQAPVLTLEPALAVTIQVLDTQAQPIVDAGVTVELSVATDEDADERRHYSICARTNAKGMATLPAVPSSPVWDVAIRVTADGLPQFFETDYSDETLRQTEPVCLTLPAGGTVQGRVCMADGRPGTGVSVAATHDPIDPNPFGTPNEVLTDDEGGFQLHGVPSEALLLLTQLCTPKSDGPYPNPKEDGAKLTQSIRVPEGGVLNLGDITLPSALTISGVVLDPSGQPTRSANVMLSGTDRLMSSQMVALDGTFTIEGVEPGVYSIEACWWDDAEQSAGRALRSLHARVHEVRAGTRDLAIHVTGGGNLTVRFHPADTPEEAVEIESPAIWWDDASRTVAVGGVGGAHATYYLEPGMYGDLKIRAFGYNDALIPPTEVQSDRVTIVDAYFERKPE